MDNENISLKVEEESQNNSVQEEQSEKSAQELLEQQIHDLKDQLLRALAENENVRKRTQREKEEALKFGVTNLARDIVTVADNLRRALENKTDSAENVAEALLSGVDLILKDLESVFNRHGIERIQAQGQTFDPHLHQAMFEVETNEQPAGTVVQVVQDGYKLHDRLLRPAMVGIAKPKAD